MITSHARHRTWHLLKINQIAGISAFQYWALFLLYNWNALSPSPGPPQSAHTGRMWMCKKYYWPALLFLKKSRGNDLQTITPRLWTQNQYSRWIENLILSKSVQKSKSYVDFKSRFFWFDGLVWRFAYRTIGKPIGNDVIGNQDVSFSIGFPIVRYANRQNNPSNQKKLDLKSP